MKSNLWSAVSAVLICFGGTAESAIITNGSFETVPSGATGQGILPSGWLNAPIIVPGADTYSNDGSYGLAPSDFGNFTGVIAFDGIRWVAGSAFGRLSTSTTVGGEAFGTTLAMALTPGTAYQLDAHLYQALRSDLNNPGGYHLFLASDNSAAGLAAATLLGALAPTTTGVGAWEARSLGFVAPLDAASRPFLVFAPYQATAGNTYPGIDAVVLSASAIPEPSSLALFVLASTGLMAFRRRNTRKR